MFKQTQLIPLYFFTITQMYFAFQNASQIVESINVAVQRLHKLYAIDTDFKMSAQAMKVVTMVEALKDRKMMTASELWTQLGDVEDWFNFQSLEKVLKKMHIMVSVSKWLHCDFIDWFVSFNIIFADSIQQTRMWVY